MNDLKPLGAKNWIGFLIKIIYLSFAFDSILKVGVVGLQFHLGIIAVFIVNVLLIISRPKDFIVFKKTDKYFYFFLIYVFFNGIIFNGVTSIKMFIYLFLAFNIYLFINYFRDVFNKSFFLQFQIILIVTGLFQFILYVVFNYQIAFINPEHYEKGFSVAKRLRGFFLEPNWYSIAITFNTILLVRNNLLDFFKNQRFILIMTLVVILLNGSIGLFVILFLFYSFYYLRRRPIFAVVLFLFLSIGLNYVFKVRHSVRSGKIENQTELLNYGSRIIPVVRAHEYINKNGVVGLIFGNGFGTWGTVAIKNNISLLVEKSDPMVRGASELPVIIFELGYLGLFILILDLISLYSKIDKRDFDLTCGIFLFLTCILLYPILKFWMYMPYYFILRGIITRTKETV
jgi:hypothetical protein